MQINADLRARAVVDSSALDWVSSPLPGVERRMLERDGDEVARATSIVRYAAGSSFSAHSHGGGEEFLVLDGVFSDEHGDFGPGSYVRNPPGSRHTPRSDRGCTIFVKLWQMEPGERQRVRLDTGAGSWRDGPAPGVRIMPLFESEAERVSLVHMAAGATWPAHGHPHGEEIFVLDGAFEDEHGSYGKGWWLRQPPGSRHAVRSPAGCLMYLKTGHLSRPPRPPAA